jgi:hypothetical protein
MGNSLMKTRFICGLVALIFAPIMAFGALSTDTSYFKNIQANSALADNPTNVVILGNSTTTWNDPAARLLTLRNNSTNVAGFNPFGGLYLGRGPLTYWGDAAEPLIVAVRDSAVGETPDAYGMFVSMDSSIANTFSHLTWYGYSASEQPNGYLELQARLGGTNSTFKVEVDPFGFTAIRLTYAGSRFTDTTPFRVTPESTTLAYKLGTSIATTGTLLSVLNAGVSKFDVDFAGQLGVISAIVTNNIGALLSVGDTTFVDLSKASQTNSVTGALTFAHATNGVHGLEKTHARWFFVPSGGPHTLTLPALWRTNVYSSVPPALTNGTITVMYVKSGGPTDTAARQTNSYVSFEYYK